MVLSYLAFVIKNQGNSCKIFQNAFCQIFLQLWNADVDLLSMNKIKNKMSNTRSQCFKHNVPGIDRQSTSNHPWAFEDVHLKKFHVKSLAPIVMYSVLHKSRGTLQNKHTHKQTLDHCPKRFCHFAPPDHDMELPVYQLQHQSYTDTVLKTLP